MKDPYEILGVQRTADEAAIRAAYRKLAKKHHPDVNPGKPDAATRFGEISSAYDLLSDKDKRARFDRGEIDAEGHERGPDPSQWYRAQADGPGEIFGRHAPLYHAFEHVYKEQRSFGVLTDRFG